MTLSDPHETGNTAVVPAGTGFSSQDKRSHLVQLVLDSVTSPHSKRAYRTGLAQFFAWWAATAPVEPFGRPLVQRYRAHLEQNKKAPATINRSLAPLRKLAEEATFAGLLPAATAGGVRAVKGAKRLGGPGRELAGARSGGTTLSLARSLKLGRQA